MLNIPVPEYKVEIYDGLGDYYKSLDLDIEPETCYISARQYEDFHSFGISAWDGNPLYLNGERLQIDQRLTDEQIIRSLSRVKGLLYQKFGVSFTDAKVIRNFDAYSEYGAKSIEDHVSFTYLFYDGFGGLILPQDSLGIPFYAFYKEIGTGENGNIIYARTYVPAIELDGLNTYFIEQQKEHR